MENFSCCTGIWKPNNRHTEKFLVYLVTGEGEVSLYQATQIGLAEEVTSPDNPTPPQPVWGGKKIKYYTTNLMYVKVFSYQSKFGSGNIYHSFYFRLDSTSNTIAKILPFGMEKSEHFFEARGKLLKKKEALEIVKGASRGFLLKQQPLNVTLLNSVIKQTKIEEEVTRKIRVIQ